MNTNGFDRRYTSEIRKIPASWQPLMRVISLLGEPVIIVSLGLGALVIAANRHNAPTFKAYLYGGMAYSLNIILKLILHRRRPHGRVVRTLGFKSYSFPSGHAFGSVILYGLLAHSALNHISNSAAIGLILSLTTLIVLIGVSRVYLDSHFPSDVFAGWVLGGLSLFIVVSLAY
jgi:undecaprenyl-diphosphatase